MVDNKAPIVRLIHVTLQEYPKALVELFGAAHVTILEETCLIYLILSRSRLS